MKQTPLPMVSGRYFLPNAPVLCLKWMPDWAVTSTNSIAPEGRGTSDFTCGVATGEGVTDEGDDADAENGAVSGDFFSTSAGGGCWPPSRTNDSAIKRIIPASRFLKNNPLARNCPFMQPRAQRQFAGNRTTFRPRG